MAQWSGWRGQRGLLALATGCNAVLSTESGHSQHLRGEPRFPHGLRSAPSRQALSSLGTGREGRMPSQPGRRLALGTARASTGLVPAECFAALHHRHGKR